MSVPTVLRRFLSIWIGAALFAAPGRAAAATFVVTNANAGGDGSLAQAISDANATQAADTITFEIATPGPVSIPAPFPPITAPVTIDGYTQDTASVNTAVGSESDATILVQLSGSALAPGDAILEIASGPSVVKGLAFRGIQGGRVAIAVAAAASGVKIQGCFVGTTSNGFTDSSGGTGIVVEGPDALIGGSTSPAERNVISGNNRAGIELLGAGATVSNNLIGLDAAGDVLGNGDGVLVGGPDADDNTIGGPGELDSNAIAGNDSNGVTILADAEGSTHILDNRIFDNDELGIDLGNDGVTSNDVNDGDAGANSLQNFPVITDVSVMPGEFEIEGSLDVSAAGSPRSYLIQVYAGETCDPSGHGEGGDFLGAEEVELSGNSESFSFTLPFELEDGVAVSATATDVASGRTSEFSRCVIDGVPASLCGDASLNGDLSAGDALKILKTGVGTDTCEPCVCDVNKSSSISSSDALLVLKAAVGQSVVLDCPQCS